MLNSKIYKVLDSLKKKSCSYHGNDEMMINTLMNDVTKYLTSLEILGYLNNDNMDRVMEQLQTIQVVCPYRHYLEHEKHFLLIETNQHRDYMLTEEEKRSLDAYQKIGEYLLIGFHKRYIQIESLIMSSGEMADVTNLVNGFDLLLKAISQELAEQVFSYQTGKFRNTRMINHPSLFEHPVETDFYQHEECEEPAKLFAGVLLDDDKSQAFLELAQISFDEDFITNITALSNENVKTLLIGMGCIKEVLDKKCSFATQASLAMDLLEESYHKVADKDMVKRIKQ